MMKLEDYKVVFASLGLIGVLLFASPTLGLFLHLPGGEKFSEFWLLGPGHMAEAYPFEVRAGENYMVYVGVGNHMGSSAYYLVYVKFRNQTEPLPNATAETPSPLLPLFTYKIFLEDGGTWEQPLNFSFHDVSFKDDRCLVCNLTVNGITLNVGKPALWDSENKGYFYQLFLELWIYDEASRDFHFHNRFVSIWLNITTPI
jgi:hypothetical protein